MYVMRETHTERDTHNNDDNHQPRVYDTHIHCYHAVLLYVVYEVYDVRRSPKNNKLNDNSPIVL